VRDTVWDGRRTGEVANGDGDGGDGGEAHVVERGEVADHLGEGRVPIHHRVLRLRRRGDVRIHRVEQGAPRIPPVMLAAAAAAETADLGSRGGAGCERCLAYGIGPSSAQCTVLEVVGLTK